MRNPFLHCYRLCIALVALSCGWGYTQTRSSPIVSPGKDGKLQYYPDAVGNQVPDFSHCGYAGGDRSIPTVPVRVIVEPKSGDATARIQKAIDYVGTLAPDSNGLRGAVLLLKGRHEVFGALKLNVSGVVLRGEGMNEDETLLVAAGQDRRSMIQVGGKPRPAALPSEDLEISDAYVPVGARRFHVRGGDALKTGDTVQVIRPSTQSWIEQLAMNQLGGGVDWRFSWKPGSRDLSWDRVVQSNHLGLVTVDAPLTTSLETRFGGARLRRFSWPERLNQVGIENLRCLSAFDDRRPKDEDHAWIAVSIENSQNVWVRQITGLHFAGSLVSILPECKWVTVENCVALAPVSELGGYRRHTFFTQGELTLFLNCWSEGGRHDFSVGDCAAGPNAFVHCEASQALSDSGPIESWASGVLYDNVRIDGHGLSLGNRGPSLQGAGWAAANCVLWQCSASRITCDSPPTAQNWAVGCWGEFAGSGIWRESNEFVRPASLYQAQVADRLGVEKARALRLLSRDTTETTNLPADKAGQLSVVAREPAPQLREHIVRVAAQKRLSTIQSDAPQVDALSDAPRGDRPKNLPKLTNRAAAFCLTNGWLTVGGRLLIGSTTNVGWWRGNLRANEARLAEPAITRFVPGRTGFGYTDDLDELVEVLADKGVATLEHHHGLWYDRRRDDHQRIRRIDGDVWPPFFEQPFARSGQGVAWDGLSLYDLTRYNPWYWSRLKQAAAACQARGLVLFHQNYFQHNILEAGAHWADFPWRTANNVNRTGFPEPPPYAGDKRIFMASQFYDVHHPARRQLHRAYIRQCLENFRDQPNVIQFTSAEFTGPQLFVEFWLDVIAEWKQETGQKPLIALSCTKDIQDEILSSGRSRDLVDVIDFRYWWSTDLGLFAPAGGESLSPRQFERQWKGGRPQDRHLAHMAAEYRAQYPGKAVIGAFPQAGWAFLCAGGSIPRLPPGTAPELLVAIPQMQPWPEGSGTNQWALREGGRQYLIYCAGEDSGKVDLSGEQGAFQVRKVNLDTGQVGQLADPIAAGSIIRLPMAGSSAAVFWLVHNP